MFYNSYRSTKSALRKRQLSGNHTHRNLSYKEKYLNVPKRQKLKKLLIEKFMQKYNLLNPEEILDPLITKFIQSEKINDVDLKNLDTKIQKIIKDKKLKDDLKTKLTNNFDETNENEKPFQTEVNVKQQEKEIAIPPIPLTIPAERNKNLKNNKELPKIMQYNNINSETNTISYLENNKKNNRGYSSYMPANKRINFFKTPEEELAELEKELEENDGRGGRTYRRIDFTSDGDEWNAILKYNKRLFDRKVLEEKLKDQEIKKRTKNYLDLQVKEKIKKEVEDELKEKEYDKIQKEHAKELDEIEKIKAKKIKDQIQGLKEQRDVLLKNEKIRKRIEELKEKKFDKNLVEHYKESLEIAKRERIEKKRRNNEALKKAIKENELKHKLLLERIKKEKEDELKINEEKLKLDLRQDNERNRYYEKIKKNGNKYTMVQADEILEQLKKEQKEEEKKIQTYYDAKNKEAHDKETKERMRRKKERQEMKKYLDMQIEEKRKEENLLKILDEEQARIWNVDCKKFFDDEKIAENKIKLMYKINFDALKNQIEEKKRSKSRQNIMSDQEYAMNRDILEKAQNEKIAQMS